MIIKKARGVKHLGLTRNQHIKLQPELVLPKFVLLEIVIAKATRQETL
jgi:hypothetical protein